MRNSRTGRAGLATAGIACAAALTGCGGNRPAAAPTQTRTVTRLTSPLPPVAATAGPPGPAPTSFPASPAAPRPVPAGYLASAASFVSANAGFVLGTAECGASRCQLVARTTDGGARWSALPTPQIPQASVSETVGISDIAFENANVGFLFGPSLFTTADGGMHWTQPDGPGYVPGDHVRSLAVTAAGAYALVSSSPNEYDLEYAASGANAFGLIATHPADFSGLSRYGRSIAAAGTDGLIVVNPTLVPTGDASSYTIRQFPALGGDASCGVLATTSAELVLCCGGFGHGGEPATRAMFTSADDGRTWRRVSDLPLGDASTMVAKDGASSGTDIVMSADDQGTAHLLTSHDGGRSWRTTKTLRAWGSDTIASMAFVGPHTIIAMYGFQAADGGVFARNPPSGVGGLLRSDDGGDTWRFVPVR